MNRACPTPDCGRPSRPDARRCWRCTKRAYRAAHPERDAFHLLRHHAAERGIAVDLSFAAFRYFCSITNYATRKGNGGDDLTIDRYDAEQGYCETNIQILPRSENSRKWNVWDRPRRLAARERRAA